MKLLIAILSCNSRRKWQQAQRDTWLKDLPEGVDYKFFLGKPCPIDLHADEVFVDVPDNIELLPIKTQAAMRWSVNSGYPHTYKCDLDTFVVPKNLLACGFETQDYVGGMLTAPGINWASGGSGYILSQRLANFVADANHACYIAGIPACAEDVFVARICYANKMSFCGVPQFKYAPDSVLTKKTIAFHLSSCFGWGYRYRPELMYKAYEDYAALCVEPSQASKLQEAAKELVMPKPSAHARHGYCRKHKVLGCIPCSMDQGVRY